MKCQMVAGPMPPKVVMTHGRKRRPRAAEPAGGRRTISERGLTRSDRSPEDQRPIEDLTSKPRPNSEPALSFFSFGAPHRRNPI